MYNKLSKPINQAANQNNLKQEDKNQSFIDQNQNMYSNKRTKHDLLNIPFYSERELTPSQLVIQRATQQYTNITSNNLATTSYVNQTGLPNNLKSGIENLSGFVMDDVRVHYNSNKPKEVDALAYTKGLDIYVAPGQERHLAHEAWHVVQQKQGRVKPNVKLNRNVINNNKALEQEAELMGFKALAHNVSESGFDTDRQLRSSTISQSNTIQRKTGFELELDVPAYMEPTGARIPKLANDEKLTETEKLDIQSFLAGGLKYKFMYGIEEHGFYHLTADHNEFQKEHIKLVKSLQQKGLVNEFPFRAMTNLEYVTPPFTELSLNLFGHVATQIQSHAQDTVNNAKSGSKKLITAPARQIFTGIPIQALEKWVGDDGGLKAIITNLNNSVTGKAYYQQSSGLLPSEITTVFKTALTELDTQIQDSSSEDKNEQSIPTVSKIKRDLLSGALELGQSFTKELINVPSIQGILTLISQYLIASFLEKYPAFGNLKTTAKNRVAYLSRVELQNITQALPNKSHTFLIKYWEKVKDSFIKGATEIADDIAAKFKFEKSEESVKDRAVFGKFDYEVVDNLEKIISGKGGVIAIGPGESLPLDEVNDPTELKLADQKLIPMEDRDLSRKISELNSGPNKIADVLNARWQNMYDLRTSSYKENAETLKLKDSIKELLFFYDAISHYAETKRFNEEIVPLFGERQELLNNLEKESDTPDFSQSKLTKAIKAEIEKIISDYDAKRKDAHEKMD